MPLHRQPHIPWTALAWLPNWAPGWPAHMGQEPRGVRPLRLAVQPLLGSCVEKLCVTAWSSFEDGWEVLVGTAWLPGPLLRV
jgi:hypothetical protein